MKAIKLVPALAAGLLVSMATAPAALAICVSAKCTDTVSIEQARDMIQETCGCQREGQRHKIYVKCVKRTLKLAELTALIPQRGCRKLILKCERQSICGKPNAAICCSLKRNGKARAKIVKNEFRCNNGSACGAILGLYSKFDACADDGTCAGPVPTTTTTLPTTTTTLAPVTTTTVVPETTTTTEPETTTTTSSTTTTTADETTTTTTTSTTTTVEESTTTTTVEETTTTTTEPEPSTTTTTVEETTTTTTEPEPSTTTTTVEETTTTTTEPEPSTTTTTVEETTTTTTEPEPSTTTTVEETTTTTTSTTTTTIEGP